MAAEIEFPFWNWRLNRMSETCRLNRRSNWQREDYIRKRRVMPVRSGLGKKGTLPPPLLRKNVILGELNRDNVQECDSKGLGGGESCRRTPVDWLSGLILCEIDSSPV